MIGNEQTTVYIVALKDSQARGGIRVIGAYDNFDVANEIAIEKGAWIFVEQLQVT